MSYSYDQGAREQIASLYSRLTRLELRLDRLEEPVPVTGYSDVLVKSQAAEMQARIAPDLNLYAPLRSDTRAVIDLAAFARRLIDMQDLGHAVTDEVRELAKRALGLK